MPADLLATISAEIDARLGQLRAAMDEYEQLLSAAAALEAEERKAKPAREKAAPVRKKPAARKAPAAAKAAARPQAAVPKEPAPAPTKPARAAAAPKKKAAKPASSASSGAQQAIVAALEHGSHTAAELAIVTAMSGPSIREGLRALAKARKVTKAKREGKAAYALAS